MFTIEPVSPPAQPAAFNKYFVEKTQEGWAIFYKEPNAPETGKACIGGSTDEQIARLRCRILNSHISNVIDAVDFAKTQERLTSRCLCVGEWKAGCPVHDSPAQPAGGARELAEEIVWQRANQELSPEQEIIWLTGKLEACAAIMRLRTELEHEQAGGVSFTFEERTQVLRYLAMNARGGTWPIDWNSDIVKRVLEKIQPATYSSVRL